MATYKVSIARTRHEYGSVEVEAAGAEAAELEVQRVLDHGCKAADYCELANQAHWEDEPESFDDHVIDVEPAE